MFFCCFSSQILFFVVSSLLSNSFTEFISFIIFLNSVIFIFYPKSSIQLLIVSGFLLKFSNMVCISLKMADKLVFWLYLIILVCGVLLVSFLHQSFILTCLLLWLIILNGGLVIWFVSLFMVGFFKTRIMLSSFRDLFLFWQVTDSISIQ